MWGPHPTLTPSALGPDPSTPGWSASGTCRSTGAARRFWLLKGLRSQLSWKRDWLPGDGAWTSPWRAEQKGEVWSGGHSWLGWVESLWARNHFSPAALSHDSQSTAGPSAAHSWTSCSLVSTWACVSASDHLGLGWGIVA